jgi:chromate transport protein ChrA
VILIQIVMAALVLASIFLLTADETKNGSKVGIASCIVGTFYFAATGQWPLIVIEVAAVIFYLRGVLRA